MKQYLPVLNKPRSLFYVIGLVFLIIGLVFSNAMISLSQVVIGANWLFDKRILKKLKAFIDNKPALLFSAIYLIFLLGLINTSNFEFSLGELKTRLPFLVLPLIISTSPKLSEKDLRFFLLLFAASSIASLSTSFYIYLSHELKNYRDAFPFISHIRLSLAVVISIGIIFYYSFLSNKKIFVYRMLFFILLVIVIYMLILMELMSGVILLSSFVIISLLFLFKKYKAASLAVSSFLLLFAFFLSYLVIKEYKYYNGYKNTEEPKVKELTANGNKYIQLNQPYENSNKIGLNVCWKEMEKEWNEVSDLDFNGKDNSNQLLKFTLLRYLNSKSLTKDSVGVSELSKTDIENIENGIANYIYAENFSYKKRLYKIFWEMHLMNKGANTAGHSVVQRFELWKSAIELNKQNLLFGLGTGDISDELKSQLNKNNFQLYGFNYRPHNQYLSYFLTYGIIGGVIIFFLIFLPPFKLRAFDDYLFVSFFIVSLFSMIWEDTLETQVGVSMFVLLYSLMLFGREKFELSRTYSN